MENTFNLKKFLAEGKLLKEEFTVNSDGEQIEIIADSGDYSGFIEEDGTVSFSVVYEGILGPNHAFVKIIDSIGGEVEALGDYVQITVDANKLKDLK